MLSHEDMKDHLTNLRIDWNFNLEKAPWWGGKVYQAMSLENDWASKTLI